MRCLKLLWSETRLHKHCADDHTRGSTRWKIWSDYAENAGEETFRPLQLRWSILTYCDHHWGLLVPTALLSGLLLFASGFNLARLSTPSLRSGHLCCIGNWILFTDRCYARLDSSPVVSSEALLQAWKSIQRLKNPVKARIVIEKDMFMINNLSRIKPVWSDSLIWDCLQMCIWAM